VVGSAGVRQIGQNKYAGQVEVSGEGFPPIASGHVWVDVDDQVSGPHFISNHDIVPGTDMDGRFTYTDNKPILPTVITDGDTWFAKARVRYPGPDPEVIAIGNVFVTVLPPG
jgi:hypothetical protein